MTGRSETEEDYIPFFPPSYESRKRCLENEWRRVYIGLAWKGSGKVDTDNTQ